MVCLKPFWRLEVHSGNISVMRWENVVTCTVVIPSENSFFRPTITSNSSRHLPKSACQMTKFIMTIFHAKRRARWLDEYTRKYTGKGSGKVGRCERVELWDVPRWFHHLATSKGKLKHFLYKPWGFQEVEAPRFQDNPHMKVVRSSALNTGHL